MAGTTASPLRLLKRTCASPFVALLRHAPTGDSTGDSLERDIAMQVNITHPRWQIAATIGSCETFATLLRYGFLPRYYYHYTIRIEDESLAAGKPGDLEATNARH
ncbi:hypothetical protein CFE70_008757 [Pyrenophora teres f. teres 0-1]